MKYLKVEEPKEFYYVDIETDSLQPSLIHCVVIKNKGSNQIWRIHSEDKASLYHELRRFILERPNAVWCGHNILSFDGPWLAFFCGLVFPLHRCVDTLVLSYLYNPALVGGHSLEAYGEKLKYLKGSITDFSKFTQDMLDYCERDVQLLELVHDALLGRMNKIGFSELSCRIEHDIRLIIDQQESNGFYFFKDRGLGLLQQLRQRESDLVEPIQRLFPPKLETVGSGLKRFRKDGSHTAQYEKAIERPDLIITENEDGTYDTSCYQPFNIGSPKQRLERLLELGYEPTARTPKGNPKIDEDSLVAYAELSGRPEIAAMAEWLVTNGRGNMIETWLGYVQADSRIHGKVFSCGATTRRMTHNSPNTANIPSGAKAKYGHECRALWGVEPGRGLKLVGYDAAGLETVGLCHYLGNPKASKVLLQVKPNDIHTMNSRSLTEALRRPVDREWGAKTSWYAWLYGAYPPKLGSIVKGPPEDGEIIIKTFFQNVPGLKRLIDDTQEEWYGRHGLLLCVDGGFVRCPSLNAALNYRIQSLGAIVMKVASIILGKKIIERGLEARKVGDIHDEGQIEAKESQAQETGEAAVQSIKEAGESLNLKEPLGGEYKIGDTWAETH